MKNAGDFFWWVVTGDGDDSFWCMCLRLVCLVLRVRSSARFNRYCVVERPLDHTFGYLIITHLGLF